MNLVNILDVPTLHGHRKIELWQGDICNPLETIDALVISAVAGSYIPTSNSVIGSLYRTHNIEVHRLASSPSLKLEALNTWMSFSGQEKPFGGILCVDVPPLTENLTSVFENAFTSLAVAERKYGPIATVAMPVLATGDHGLSDSDVIPPLMREAVSFIERSSTVVKIVFVTLSPERAERLSTCINTYLGRAKIDVASGQVADAVREELNTLISRAIMTDKQGVVLYKHIARLLLPASSQSFEVGALGRRLAEYICGRLITDTALLKKDLLYQINGLPSLGIANWIVSYMHVLRVFGNEEVHHNAKERSPPELSPADIIICLSAICRILTFWLEHSKMGWRNGSD